MKISADTPVEKLSAFERVVVEILRAVLADRRLIVLKEISTLLSEHEVVQLHAIMRHYAGKGFSFLYISPHFEEILQICSRAAIMANGQIKKILHDGEMKAETLLESSREYDSKVRGHLSLSREKLLGEIVFEASEICGTQIRNFHFKVSEGECLVIQSLDHKIFQKMTALLAGATGGLTGKFWVRGAPIVLGESRKIAVIQEQPAQSMLFYGMSYMDNLCFSMDHRVPAVWLNRKIRKSIRAEYGKLLGDAVFDKRLEELTEIEKYELVYARILLQKPDVVFCIQPFKGADMQHRIRIWELQEMLQKRGIAVVILAVNMADALSLADRVIQIDSRARVMEYQRSDFGNLPINVPWQYLYESEKEE